MYLGYILVSGTKYSPSASSRKKAYFGSQVRGVSVHWRLAVREGSMAEELHRGEIAHGRADRKKGVAESLPFPFYSIQDSSLLVGTIDTQGGWVVSIFSKFIQ